MGIFDFSKDKNSKIPDNVKESFQTNINLTLGPDVLPWEDYIQIVQLSRIRLKSGFQFYIGSVLANDDLQKLAKTLDPGQSDIANRVIYNRAEDYFNGRRQDIFTIQEPVGSKMINYLRAGRDGRVFFMRYTPSNNELNGNEALQGLLIVAKCHKGKEKIAMSSISKRKK